MALNKMENFFKRYIKAIDASGLTQRNTLVIVRKLLGCDPLHKITFELSFKLNHNNMTKQIRFLTMDRDTYSCKSPFLFRARLEIYNKIMRGRVINPLLPNLIRVLTQVSTTPMDLYFGADIKDDNYLFAFWLIFGGVKRTGEVTFWPYNFKNIIEKALFQIKFKKPKFLKKDILNLGFDIDNKNVFYKLYYLLRDKDTCPSPFTNLMEKINRNLSDYKYFYFFSQMHNREGECIKNKIFIEFLEDLRAENIRTRAVLKKVLEIYDNRSNFDRILKVIKTTGGRLSLMSFEVDGTLTFYIRPD